MRVRKISALVGAALVLAGCLILYMMMDLAVFPSDVHDVSSSVILQNCFRSLFVRSEEINLFCIKCINS
jgi:hypothetical protein